MNVHGYNISDKLVHARTERRKEYRTPVIATGVKADGKALAAFGMDPPNTVVDPQNQRWIPVIPLCGAASEEVPHPVRASMSDDYLDDVVDRRGGTVLVGISLQCRVIDRASGTLSGKRYFKRHDKIATEPSTERRCISKRG